MVIIMTAPLDLVLSRLEKVRQTGPDRWLARCPAHEDKTASLSIREMSDGRVLIHDFGGCPTIAVLDALSLEMGDLYPEKLPVAGTSPRPRPFPALDVLRAIYSDALVVLIAACAIRRRGFLPDPDIARLDAAVERIGAGLTAAENSARLPHH
jgi:hypothetical protein